MTATLDRPLLEHALGAAGFQRGERFELKRRVDGGMRATRVVDPQRALTWIDRGGPRDLYLTLNPLKPAADPPQGVSREQDILQARALNVDVDPASTAPEDRAAARELALEVRAWIEELGARPALIDSGRGHQLWLLHEPIAAEASLEVRELVLRGLAHRFRRAGAKVDPAPFGARFAGRLPGSTNGKTGDLARIVDAGDGRALAWGTLAELAARWRAELPPAAPPPRKLPAEVVKVLSEVNETRGALRDAWRWIGAKAAREGGVHDLVRSHVPGIYCDDFDTGARGAHARWPRPFDDAFEKRATRAFESLTRKQQKEAVVKEAKELIEIVSLIRRTEGRGRGAKIDLELRVGEETYALSGLDTKELGSYAAIRARAMGEGALLPDLEKEARSVWREKLAEGWARMRTEVVREGTTHRALIDAIRETLRVARAGRSQSDFLRGHVIRLSDERVAIVASELMIRARTKVLPDVVSREQVLDAARELDVDSEARPVLPDGSRMRAWTFPARVLDTDD